MTELFARLEEQTQEEEEQQQQQQQPQKTNSGRDSFDQQGKEEDQEEEERSERDNKKKPIRTKIGREARRAARADKRDERARKLELREKRRAVAEARVAAAPAPHLRDFGFARSNAFVDPERLPVYAEARVVAEAAVAKAEAAVSVAATSASSVQSPSSSSSSWRPPLVSSTVKQQQQQPPQEEEQAKKKKKKRRWVPYEPDVSRMSDQVRLFFDTHVKTTAEQRRLIATYVQGSPEWKEARHGKMGGSTLAAAVGDHPYQKPDELVSEMIDPQFQGNEATDRGSRLEPIARRLLLHQERRIFRDALRQALDAGETRVQYRRRWYAIPPNVAALKPAQVYDIIERGAKVSEKWHNVRSSSDGDIHIFGKKVGIIEIKTTLNNRMHTNAPFYYYAQIQGNMHVHEVGFCLVMCYVEPTGAEADADGTYEEEDGGGGDDSIPLLPVDHFEYDQAYCEHYLFPRVQRFFFQRYLPTYFRWDAIRRSGSDADQFLQQFRPVASKPTLSHIHGYEHAGGRGRREDTKSTNRTGSGSGSSSSPYNTGNRGRGRGRGRGGGGGGGSTGVTGSAVPPAPIRKILNDPYAAYRTVHQGALDE